MGLPDVVPREVWLAARKELLAREKEFTRRRDELSTDRRRLPMVKIEKRYAFDGPAGRVGLLELFDGCRQLVVCHFMFDPGWEDGCPSCTAGADEMSPGHLAHLRARDTNLVYVSRAPLERIEAYKARRGWAFPWYSSHGSDFNYDFHVTLDEARTPVEYNYRSRQEYERAGLTELAGEMPGRSHFLRLGDEVFHTYSVYARGLESIGGSYYLLDETALGRQEDWEEPRDRVSGVRRAVPDFAS